MVDLRLFCTLALAAIVLSVGSCRSSKSQGEVESSVPEVWYVRPGAAGEADGSSWADAFSELPRSLRRRSKYWLGVGNYGPRDFDDRAIGEHGIVLRKATSDEHGTDLGWEPEYGEGRVVFGPIRFGTGRYTLDGGEPAGVKVVGALGEDAAVRIEGRHVTLRYVEVDGGFREEGGKQTRGACNGVDIHGDHATLDRCEIHNVADDGLGIYADHVRVQRTEIHDLAGCGTDGGCGPCYNGHSDGIELSGAKHVELLENLVYDVRSNAGLFMGDWSGSAVEDLLVAGNVFYTPDTGFSVYVQKVEGARFFENVIWGKTQGSKYGGLSVGPGIEDLRMQSNTILNINFSHMSTAYDPRRHQLDYNRFGMVDPDEYTPSPHDTIGDPGLAGVPMSGDAAVHRRGGLTRADFVPASPPPKPPSVQAPAR